MQSADSAELSLDSQDLAEHALRDLAADKDIMLLVSPACGQDVLNLSAGRLGSRRDRVVRITGGGGGGLSLPGLLRQLGRYAARPNAGSMDAPERDIAVITTLGPSCDRIILMVDNADALDRGALRAIELSCRTPGLRLVFAGLPSIVTLLDDPELPMLRARLLRGVRYTAIAETTSVVDTELATPKAVAPRPSRRVGGMVVAAACAVGLGLLGVVTVRALNPPEAKRPDLPEIASASAAGPASAPETVAEARPVPEPVPQPELVPGPTTPLAIVPTSDPADPAPIQMAPATPQTQGPVRSAQHRVTHRSSLNELHPAHAAHASNSLAEKDPSGDYIGTFSAGADGVRSFRYRQ